MEVNLPFTASGRTFYLDNVIIEPQRNLIVRDGKEIQVERQVMLLFLYLASREGEAVTREELLDSLWADTFANDEALTQAVSKLRKALGKNAENSSFIQTIRKVGYCLVEPVSATPSESRVSIRTKKEKPIWKWSWVAVVLIGAITTLNAAFLSANDFQTKQPMMKVRKIIPGVDTTEVMLASVNGVPVGDMDMDSLQVADIISLLGTDLDAAAVKVVNIKHNSEAQETLD